MQVKTKTMLPSSEQI